MLHVGVGNPMRQDDGVGPWLADRLAAGGLRAKAWTGDGAWLIDLFAREPALVLIDATRSGAAPGTIHRLDAFAEPLPRPFFANSTHEFGLAEAVEVARRLGLLPAELRVVGIEGAAFGPGTGLSPEVECAALALEVELLEAVRQGDARETGDDAASSEGPPGSDR